MHPRTFASLTPETPAYIIAETGESVSYRELEDAANRGARLFRSLGLVRGDVIAMLLENHPRYYQILWAAQRCGLYITCISPKLSATEADYIIENSEAKVLLASPATEPLALEAARRHPALHKFMVDREIAPFQNYEDAISGQLATPIEDECWGGVMLYSSGTTGRPKGIKHALPPKDAPLLGHSAAVEATSRMFGFNAATVYLSPAPLYHAAPLVTGMMVNRLGGTVVIMQKFDAEFALKLIEQYRVTYAQWVPTHFVRMLKLPAETRAKYDLTSMQHALHAAAPCPITIKEAMIEWWGPIVDEYYGGTENNGMTFISSEEWMSHKGSVGRVLPPGQVWICDDQGEPLPPGSEGMIYFSGGQEVQYHNDPEKTSSMRNRRGWATLGDVGVLDEEGYLYLRDRKDFMIISGGVNVYPQEIENLLLGHPAVMDAAVFGLPDAEMGEFIVAVIQPADWNAATPALAQELRRFARDGLSHIKTPRLIEFQRELPRTATGKLMKRLLRDDYLKRLEPAVSDVVTAH